MGKLHQVIIGASAAGPAAVEAIRRVDQDCPITVVSKEPLPLCSQVGLTHFIAREVGYDGMRMRDDDYFNRMKVRGLTGVAVLSVDPTAHRVRLSNSENPTSRGSERATGSAPLGSKKNRGLLPRSRKMRSSGFFTASLGHEISR